MKQAIATHECIFTREEKIEER